jgi:hypothetical protein
MTAESAEDLIGRLYGLLILVEDRLGPETRTTSSRWTSTPWRWKRSPGCSAICGRPSPTGSAMTCWPWAAG